METALKHTAGARISLKSDGYAATAGMENAKTYDKRVREGNNE